MAEAQTRIDANAADAAHAPADTRRHRARFGVYWPARAKVQVSGNTLAVTLRDGTGTVLLGPLPLGSVATHPPQQASS